MSTYMWINIKYIRHMMKKNPVVILKIMKIEQHKDWIALLFIIKDLIPDVKEAENTNLL